MLSNGAASVIGAVKGSTGQTAAQKAADKARLEAAYATPTTTKILYAVGIGLVVVLSLVLIIPRLVGKR